MADCNTQAAAVLPDRRSEEEAGNHKSAHTHAGDSPASYGKRTQRRDIWKTRGVTSIACGAGHYTRENPTWLTYAAAVILRSVWRPTRTLWPGPVTFWPHNKWVSMTHRLTFVRRLEWSQLRRLWEISCRKTNRQTALKTLSRRLPSAWINSKYWPQISETAELSRFRRNLRNLKLPSPRRLDLHPTPNLTSIRRYGWSWQIPSLPQEGTPPILLNLPKYVRNVTFQPEPLAVRDGNKKIARNCETQRARKHTWSCSSREALVSEI